MWLARNVFTSQSRAAEYQSRTQASCTHPRVSPTVQYDPSVDGRPQMLSNTSIPCQPKVSQFGHLVRLLEVRLSDKPFFQHLQNAERGALRLHSLHNISPTRSTSPRPSHSTPINPFDAASATLSSSTPRSYRRQIAREYTSPISCFLIKSNISPHCGVAALYFS